MIVIIYVEIMNKGDKGPPIRKKLSAHFVFDVKINLYKKRKVGTI